ncbi:MAG TPA: GWxTD domain-containing protein [Gemmatimonadales bacterium]|nr:GWxTD domain-containing protein [Gemmatimonadales bacterium]
MAAEVNPRRFEEPTSSAVRRVVFASALLAATACGPWQRVGAPPPRAPATEQVAALFDPSIVYRRLGYVTGVGQIRFVGNVRLLAGRTPDTALAVVGLSMQNRYLAFQRAADGFAATYRVELAFRQGTLMVQQVVRDERVVVATFAETQRAEESIIYQGFFPVPAGMYLLSIVVRDQNGPGVGRYEGPFSVPQLEAPAIATPIAVYRATPRTDLAATPDMVTNPRSTVDYGSDSLRFYVETYGLPAGSQLVAAALDSAEQPVWADTTGIDSTATLRPFVFAVAPSHLALGRHELQVGVAGGGVVARATFLVAFSGQWIAANFDEMLSLLRYFTTPDTLKALARTPPEQRAAAWRKFLHDTDPDPSTPENEALDRYFGRLLAANEQFRDEGTPGWLTDRGEVYITLGTPDQVIDPRPDYRGRGRIIEWTYDQHNLALYFVDDAGFGRLRLDPESRSEFDRVVNRLRRAR